MSLVWRMATDSLRGNRRSVEDLHGVVACRTPSIWRLHFDLLFVGVKHSHMNALWEGRGKQNVGETVRKRRGNGLISVSGRGAYDRAGSRIPRHPRGVLFPPLLLLCSS